MTFSLIISDVCTNNGYKTFTMRWYKNDSIGWYEIFDFIASKGCIYKGYYTVKIGNKYVNYNDLVNLQPFDFKKFVYYDSLGKPTGCGLLKTGISVNTNIIINK